MATVLSFPSIYASRGVIYTVKLLREKRAWLSRGTVNIYPARHGPLSREAQGLLDAASDIPEAAQSKLVSPLGPQL